MNLLTLLVISTCYVGGKDAQTTDFPIFFENCGNMSDIDRELSNRQIRFSLDFHKATADTKKGFFALSTIDAFLTLSKLLFGSKGLIEQQLSTVLHYSSDCQLAEMGLHKLIYEINHFRDDFLSLNDKMFHAYETDLEASFVEGIRQIFGVTPQRVESWENLTNGNAISAWAESVGISYPSNHTFEGEKSLVLASSAVFMRDFVVSTSHGYPTRSIFRYNDKKTVEIDAIKIIAELIHGEIKYRRGSVDAVASYVKFSWMKVHQRKIKTIILLPESIDDITELEKNIDDTMLREILSNNVTSVVIATLPKFITIQSSYDLREPLLNMRVTEMFKETGDFANIVKTRPIKVGPIFHQVAMSHEWIPQDSLDFKKKVQTLMKRPASNFAKLFNVDGAFMILTVFESDNPIILSMGRHGWVPGVTDAEIWNNM